jgi:TFIIF-interacting CTD phosphatase-like protein
MINILLDLDNTIISSLSSSEERKGHKKKMSKFVWENMDGEYKVFERPGLQSFLDFLFANFNVSVWTAASKSYALFIIDNFILIKPERKLDYIFFSYHCKESRKKQSTQKKLEMLWNRYNLKGRNYYNKDNTLIIDDHPEVFEAQPENCIRIKPFEFRDRKSYDDDDLIRIKLELEKLL